ncbi:MAG TPA: dATP pyrophosphohydrolase [Stellaceae bacterium]|nr:dATP pyrophosphohydrolase [Stellaceae bacterium]
MTPPITVTEVVTRRDFRRFLELPHLVYRNDPHWIAPLHSEVRKVLDRRRNPFFDHGEACYWLAWRGDTPVGRISAQVNRLHLETHHDATGNFGFLEAVDDPAVFAALLGTAEIWVKARGLARILGPYSLSMNDEIGVLVSGFSDPPVIAMTHAPPYYGPRLEAEGYAKAKDLYAFRFEIDEARNRSIAEFLRHADRINREGRVRVRHIDMRRFETEMRAGIGVYNDGWSANWGFVPVTPREVEHLLAALKPVIHPLGILLGEIDGQIAGLFVAIPDLNELIADLHGKLFPLGWAKLLWRLRTRTPKGGRVMLAGLTKSYQNSAVGAAMLLWMFADIFKSAHDRGYRYVEFSWVLEDNARSIALCERAGGQLYKTYRLYQKSLE